MNGDDDEGFDEDEGDLVSRTMARSTTRVTTWWELVERLGEAGDTLYVLRRQGERVTGVCNLGIYDPAQVRLREDNGAVCCDWPKYVYHFTTVGAAWAQDGQYRILDRATPPPHKPRIRFQSRPLSPGERAFPHHACIECGQRSLALVMMFDLVPWAVCRVCGSTCSDQMIYPYLVRYDKLAADEAV